MYHHVGYEQERERDECSADQHLDGSCPLSSTGLSVSTADMDALARCGWCIGIIVADYAATNSTLHD
jgi:hypothetical protein